MAAENFKVKKGLEVGTGITANSDGVNVTGIITATQFKGDGSGLTGVVGSGSGVVVKDEGSAVGTAGTINFVGTGVAAAIAGGTATVTVNAGGLDNVVEDTTPQLGGNLDLNSKFVTGSGGINVTGVVTATTLKGNGDFVDIDVDGHTELDNLNVAGVSTFISVINANNGINLTDSDNKSILLGESDDMRIRHTGSHSEITDEGTGSLRLGGNNVVIGSATFGVTMASFAQGGAAKLYHNDQQKLTTTINGIEVPDLNVTGVGTVGRLETSGVTLGTNNNTFAAKFIDDAVANFGTDNDLKISHDDTHARITNTKGNIVVSGIISAISDVKVGSAITMDPTSGIITATSFSGSGSGLTSIPSAQLSGALPALDGSALTGITASGSGIIVKHDGSTVGTAGTINFSTNLDVSAISAGIVTVTASGGSIAGISTTGTSVFNEIVVGSAVTVNARGINIVGAAITAYDITADNNLITKGGNLSGSQRLMISGGGGFDMNYYSGGTAYSQHIFRLLQSGSSIERFRISQHGVNVGGIATATTFSGSGASLTTLNASELDSGTIPNGRFPATLPAVSGVNLTTLNASEITSGTLPIARIADDAVTFAKMQNVGTGVFIGRNDSGTGDIETLTAAEARTLLNVADGATAGITTASSNVTATWSITASDSNGYEFTGPGQDGSEDDPDIYLMRGHKYRFVNTTGNSHPFEFRNAANDADYTDGITGAQNGTQEFSVQHDAPAALKYRCTIHTGNMLGNIYIVGQHLANGANNRVLTATSAYGMNGESNLTFDGSTLNNTNGGANFTKSANNYILVGSTNASGASLVLDGDSNGDGSGTDYAFLTHNTDGDLDIVVDNPANAGNIKFFTNSSSERVRITSGGQVVVGDTANRLVWGINPTLQVNGTEWDDTCIALHNFGNNTTRPSLLFTKGRSGTLGNFGTAVNAGEGLGIIGWSAHDTTDAENLACYIQGISESAPTTNNQYGAITFSTVNGGASAYERLRITSGGNVNFGAEKSVALPSGTGIQVYHSTNPRIKLVNDTTGNGATDGTQIYLSSDGDTIIDNKDSEDIIFHSNASEKLRIDSYGVLRIGNTHDQTTSGNTKRIALGAKGSIWGWASGQINGALNLADNYYWDGVNNKAIESDYSAYLALRSGSLRYGSTDAANTAGGNSSGITERFRLFKNELRHGSTNILGGSLDDVRIRNSSSYKGLVLRGTGGSGGMANHNEYCFLLNRMGSDGDIVQFYAQGSKEGSISVSGSTVSYNGGHLSRWSQLVGISTNVKSDRPTIYQGTVMSNLDEMCEWPGEENQQLNKTKVSDTVGDKDVAGVFWTWDDDDDVYTNDFYVAMTGDMVIRVAASTTVARGDLLESAGDGTAKPQSDDIVRSKTVAKVTSGIAHTTYPDGTKTYPCVLMGS